jgi:hypothetical protein
MHEIIDIREVNELYTRPYNELSIEKLEEVARMADDRGESWKVGEIADYAQGLSERYHSLVNKCDEMRSEQLEGMEN